MHAAPASRISPLTTRRRPPFALPPLPQYERGFVRAFDTLPQHTEGDVWYTSLEWNDEQALTLTAALEYVRDHCEMAHGKKLRFNLRDNDFGAEAQAAIKKAVERPDGLIEVFKI